MKYGASGRHRGGSVNKGGMGDGTRWESDAQVERELDLHEIYGQSY